MASDGITNYAKRGRCRICQRVLTTNGRVMAVGEVRHGFATGHVWECIDTTECDKAANAKLDDPLRTKREKSLICMALEEGRFREYKYFS